jgi:hypothetical protein
MEVEVEGQVWRGLARNDERIGCIDAEEVCIGEH